MKIEKETLKQFRNDFSEAVKALEAKYNIKISLLNIKYDNIHFEGKINVDSLETSDLEKKETSDNELLSFLGAKFKVGFEFDFQGKKLKVKGLKNTRSKKNIILSDSLSGKDFISSVDMVNLFVKEGI